MKKASVYLGKHLCLNSGNNTTAYKNTPLLKNIRLKQKQKREEKHKALAPKETQETNSLDKERNRKIPHFKPITRNHGLQKII